MSFIKVLRGAFVPIVALAANASRWADSPTERCEMRNLFIHRLLMWLHRVYASRGNHRMAIRLRCEAWQWL